MVISFWHINILSNRFRFRNSHSGTQKKHHGIKQSNNTMSAKLCRTIVIRNNILYFLQCFISYSYLNSDATHTGVLDADDEKKM